MKLKKTVKGVGSKGNTLRGSVLKKPGKRDKPYEVRTPIDPRTKKRGFFLRENIRRSGAVIVREKSGYTKWRNHFNFKNELRRTC